MKTEIFIDASAKTGAHNHTAALDREAAHQHL